MKKSFSKIVLAIIGTTLISSSVSAFDIKLVYAMPSEARWTNDTDSSFTSTSTTTINGNTTRNTTTTQTHHDVDQMTTDDKMIGLEFGHYKNANNEGFGFGWHIGFAYPISEDFNRAGTVDFGIAPGYSITQNLAVKLELGLGIKRGFSVKDDSEVENAAFFAGVYGLSAEYVLVNHLVIGGAVKFREYISSDTYGIAKATPEVSVAYRF